MRDKIIIVEGPQGVGKTTFTNYLREKIPSADLYRLTGIKDKTMTGLPKIKKKYLSLIEYLKKCEDVNILFDRTFFTEEIYSRLGFKPYSFNETFNELLSEFNKLNYDIYLIVLYLQDTAEYEKRIKRDKYEYQKFEAESSIRQQNEYLKLAAEVEQKADNIKVIRFKNDSKQDFDEQLDKYFGDIIKNG